MPLEYYEPIDFVERITHAEQVSFVFGSALTGMRDGIGILEPKEIVAFIKAKMISAGFQDAFLEHMHKFKSENEYQIAFEFLVKKFGIDGVNKIIREIVKLNEDPITGKQKIPENVKLFAKAVKDKKINLKYIITTNFDTLIEEAFTNEGIQFNSLSIVSNSNINDNSNGLITIVHIHGVWDRGDTMHTRNQLDRKRGKIEESLKNIVQDGQLCVMAYGAWEDSFTRTLTSLLDNNISTYSLIWCFYPDISGQIDRDYVNVFSLLDDAISRERVQFYKGIDCREIFGKIDREVLSRKAISSPVYLNTESELKKFYISTNTDYIDIRKKEQTEAINLLTKKKMTFIEVGLGGGLYGFIYSIAIKFKAKNTYFRINFAEVIVKNQIDDTFVASTGVNSQLLIFEMNKNFDETYVIIIDNIRGDIEQEALEYLVQLSVVSRMKNSNIYFIFSSPITHTQFKESTIQLKDLTLDETSLILKRKFPTTKLDSNYIFELHNLSEGVVIKLEKIISSLNYSSPAEVLDETTLFDDIYQSDDIPQNIITQIDFISQRVDKQHTFMMLKILAILKNGESLTNLKKDRIGKDLSLKNSREIIQLGLASVIEIDTSTTLIKLNPIIKDYVLSLLTEDEIHAISSAYLKIVISETKDGIHLGVNNRKIIDKGYNTEEDNAVVLFNNSISECKYKINSVEMSEDEFGFYNTKLSRLLYLSLAYVYALDNSCRFKEAIFAATSFLQVTSDINNPSNYKLYYHLGSCQRMLSYKDEALENLKKAKELCPLNDKQTLEKIYIEELFILEETNTSEAVALSKRNKKNFKANTLGHVYSEYIASIDLMKNQRMAKLESLERKCRRLEFHTAANNILFTLNTIKEETGKISRLNKVMSTESNSYNYCKAMIYKHEILVGNSDFEKITERDLYILFDIFNYMFKQGFNSLLNRCHDVLWKIAENKRKSQVIVIIYFKSAISWQLNNKVERLEKYSALFNGIEFDDDGSMK